MQIRNAIRVALVEDNAVNRNTFNQKVDSGWKIVFVAVNGEDCLQQLKGLPLNSLPQVIFMDIEMPSFKWYSNYCCRKNFVSANSFYNFKRF